MGRSSSRSRSRSRSREHKSHSRHRSRSRSRSRRQQQQQQQLRRGTAHTSRDRSRSRSLPRRPPPAAGIGRDSSRDGARARQSSRDRRVRSSSRDRVRQDSQEAARDTRWRSSRSRSRELQQVRRSDSKRTRSRSRGERDHRSGGNRERTQRDRRHSSRSRSRERRRSRSRSRSRDNRRNSKRRSRSRSRSRDARNGSRRRGRDEDAHPRDAHGMDFPPPPGDYPGPPPDDMHHPAAKRSRWDADRQQQQQQQQPRGWGAGRPGDRRGPGGLPLSDDPPAVGSIHRGVVQTVKPFGVFVAIEGYRRHVLIHHTQVSELVVLTRSDEDDLKVKALEYAAPAGQRVWVKILEVSPDQGGSGFRVHGSMRVVDQDSGADLDPTGQLAAKAGPGGGGGRLSDEPPEVGSIHKGEVKRIEAYGVFVALPGFRKYGLVHASQVANFLEFSAEDGEAERKKAISEVVDIGQDVWVKVVEVGEDEKGRGPKIGCSMKLVDQGDGTDLDPQNLRYRPRGEGHGGNQGGNKAPIGAHAGEVKGGAIDWGYLSTRPDAFGSKGYDLLDEPPPEPVQPMQQGGPDHHHHHHQHHHHQHRQQQAPMGRGRVAVVPAWMTQGAGGPAAPGSGGGGGMSAAEEDAKANMDLEEALRIVKEAAAKSHKKRHRKEKSSKKHKKEKSSRKHSRRHRSRSRDSGSSGGGSSSGGTR